MKRSFWIICAVSGLLSGNVSAVTLFGMNTIGQLISFDSAAPGTLLSSVPVTGLTNEAEFIEAIDFRPGTGRLYALGHGPGDISRLYTINPSTGVATRV